MDAHLSTAIAEGRTFMQVVDGNRIDSSSGERIDVVSPSDGKVFASIPASGKADVDRAVEAARRAFDRCGGVLGAHHDSAIRFVVLARAHDAAFSLEHEYGRRVDCVADEPDVRGRRDFRRGRRLFRLPASGQNERKDDREQSHAAS